MALPTNQDIDTAIPVDGIPVRSLTNAALKNIAAEVALNTTAAASAGGAASAAQSDATAAGTAAADALTAANTASSESVKLTGAQTIAGVKTFSSIPAGPAANPTTANQLTRKGYVDSVGVTSATAPISYAAGVISAAVGVAVADAVDETDVVAQFNALLASLRTAGYIAT